MSLFLAALGILGAGGVSALLVARRSPGAAIAVGTGSAALGSVAGLGAAFRVLAGGPTAELRAPWAMPLGDLHLRIDVLAAFFEVVIFGLALATAVFARSYLRPHSGRRSLGAHLLFFNVLVAAMAVVVAARHATLFLVAWEVMTIASFLLVTFEHGDAEVRGAGRLYIVASHIGAGAIVALFLILARGAGSLDFDAFAGARAAAAPSWLLFALAVAGFGVKAGFFPLHVWLPEAHPAAPSHVSALMSGALVKTGIYGLLRVLGFLPAPPVAWGVALALIGVVGAVAAIALALAERDLKRALAYSTVENVGIIALALGVGIVGLAHGSRAVAALALSGGLLHVWNHALMKGLAFMGAGAIAHAAGTRDLERMGGILRRAPVTGALFLVAAAALAALPPLNGFASEWLVYLALLDLAVGAPGATALVACVGIAVVALVGALAAVAFTRAAGVALLGEPRGEGAAAAHDPPPAMMVPMAAAAALCVLLGLLPAIALPFVSRVVEQLAGEAAIAPSSAADALGTTTRVALVALLGVIGALALARRRAVGGRERRDARTWGCGFAAPTPRMQYTAASYAQMLARGPLPAALQPAALRSGPDGLFPSGAAFSLRPQDPARTRLFDPLFAGLASSSARLRRFQQGKLNLQLLYTVATLVGLAALLVLRSRYG